MALSKLNLWAKNHYADESRPTPLTLRRWAERGELPYHVERHGSRWFIDPNRPVYQDALVQSLIDRVLSDDATYP